jgi:two-component system chemotaxis response regulator CheB
MTGMGDDGATGLREMRNASARTPAQDQESCGVRHAKRGGQARSAERSVALNAIYREILRQLTLTAA